MTPGSEPETHEPPAPPPGASHPLRTALRLTTTFALAAACVVLSVLLWEARREIQQPPPGYSIVLDPADSGAAIRDADEPGPADRQVFRPPHGHRIELTLALPPGEGNGPVDESVLWAAEVLPPPGEGPGFVERASVSGGALRVELDPEPVPGPYRINLYRFDGQKPERVARYGLRIGLPEDAPSEE